MVNAHDHNVIPCLMFPLKPDYNRKRINLTKPENWHIHFLENSYLLGDGINTFPKHGKLINNSILLHKITGEYIQKHEPISILHTE